MANSIQFDYEINDFDDVRDHLDALWSEVNAIVAALSSVPPVCGDPPNTCGSLQQQSVKNSGSPGGQKGGGKKKNY